MQTRIYVNVASCHKRTASIVMMFLLMQINAANTAKTVTGMHFLPSIPRSTFVLQRCRSNHFLLMRGGSKDAPDHISAAVESDDSSSECFQDSGSNASVQVQKEIQVAVENNDVQEETCNSNDDENAQESDSLATSEESETSTVHDDVVMGPPVVETTTVTDGIHAQQHTAVATDDDDDDDLASIREQAAALRLEGKHFHDENNYAAAATCFAGAADLLHAQLSDSSISAAAVDIAEEFATCRLHEALCRLKDEDYQQAAAACTDVLELQGDLSVAAALRARAFHRRAKAELEMGDASSALQDARSAAFLGDRKAVALYGKLMREPSSSQSSMPSSSMFDADSMDFGATNALFESLLGKSAPSSSKSTDAPSNFLPTSLFGMGQPPFGNTNGGGDLAKSVLASLSKKLDDENMHDTICRYLQGTSGPQLQQMAQMAGISLQESQATRIANFCNGITPKTLRRLVKTSKRAIYGIQLIRKLFRVVAKYRSVLIILLVIGWIKSAILRPYPVKRKAVKAAKVAAKAAFSLAM